MPLSIVKILSDDSTTDLATRLATYKAGAGAELLDTQRAMAVGHFEEVDSDPRTILALAHGGLDIPGTGTKTADLQHVIVRTQGSESEMQADVDAALANVKHSEVTDGVTTTPGTVTSVTAPFAAEDVGRKIRIGSEVRTITVFNAANSVDYDNSAAEGGDFASGTGLTVELLGCEVIQDIDVQALVKDGRNEMLILMACEGEAY